MLQKQTTSPELFQILKTLMSLPLLKSFRLVGGTALSLLKGHRISEDIDLFTDQAYGSTDFGAIEELVKMTFPVVENPENAFPQLKKLHNNLGLKLNIGYNEDSLVKADILYWDPPFLFDPLEEEGIRFASMAEIAAMKLDVIARGGRKKDFWDLVELFEDISLADMLRVYQQKYLYSDPADVKRGLTDFAVAEKVPDPICLRGRSWQMVKERIREEAGQL